MMYSEFLDKTGFTEKYISYTMYTDFIEPCYMESSLAKEIFCKRFYKLHKKLVVPAVEFLFNTVDTSILENYVFGDKTDTPKQIFDIEAINNKLLCGFLINVKRRKYKELL